MKKLIILSFCLMMLQSCNKPIIEDPYRDAPTQFIVTDIMPREGMKHMSTYCVEVIDVNALVCEHESGTNKNLKFWFCDTIEKYKLGQPIHFDKTR